MLKFLFALEQVLFPTATCIIFLMNKDTFSYTSGEEHFLLGTFYLVILFVFFMQIVLSQYIPDKRYQLISAILLPFFPILIEYFTGTPKLTSLIFPGFIVFSAFIISFFIIVVILPLFSLFTKGTTKNDVRNYFILVLLECLFLVPGIGALWIFGRQIIALETPLVLITSMISLGCILYIHIKKILPNLIQESILG